MTRLPPPQPAAEYGQTAPVRVHDPDHPAVVCSMCRAYYLADPEGREAHRVVFGHQPVELAARKPAGGC